MNHDKTNQSMSRVTAAEMGTLRRALKWEGEGCGIHPTGSAQFAMFKRMEARGLLKFATFGPDFDGLRESAREYPIYTLTPRSYDILGIETTISHSTNMEAVGVGEKVGV